MPPARSSCVLYTTPRQEGEEKHQHYRYGSDPRNWQAFSQIFGTVFNLRKTLYRCTGVSKEPPYWFLRSLLISATLRWTVEMEDLLQTVSRPALWGQKAFDVNLGLNLSFISIKTVSKYNCYFWSSQDQALSAVCCQVIQPNRNKSPNDIRSHGHSLNDTFFQYVCRLFLFLFFLFLFVLFCFIWWQLNELPQQLNFVI